MGLVLVTGGVRSGKSLFAEQLAGYGRRVLYVATGEIWDGEMAVRIDLHRDRRPPQWGLLETGSLLHPLQERADEWDAVLVDCLSTWVSRLLIGLPESEWRSPETRARITEEAERFAAWLSERDGEAVVVTSETGLGGVAMTPLGRAFQDLLGEVNQIVAERADDVYLMISGRPLQLPRR